MTFIESGIAVADVAKALGTTESAVESEASQLGLFIGEAWDGRPAVSELDAHGIVSGSSRREQSHDRAWREHTAALEQYEADREAVRRDALQLAYDRDVRRGTGAAAATESGHDAARAALHDFDASHRPPEFEGSSASPASWIKTRVNKVKAAVS